MKKILYHGSEFLIEKPEFGKGARHQCGQPNVNLRQVPAQVNE